MNSKCQIIKVEGFELELSYKSIKNINLRVTTQGRIKVSAPKYTSLAKVLRFIKEKSDWIKYHQERLKEQAARLEQVKQSKDVQFYIGKCYQLIVQKSAAQQGVFLHEQTMYCFMPNKLNLTHYNILLERWYHQQMHLLLPPLIKKWEAVMGVKVLHFSVKKMKTRWGSCNPRAQRISINLLLIHKPLSCLEYVLVHELVHLLEPSHNHRFHALMTKFLPDWPEQKALLKA